MLRTRELGVKFEINSMKRRFKLITLILLSIWSFLFLIRFAFSKIDYDRVDKNLTLIFAVPKFNYGDGGSTLYQGFGYSLLSKQSKFYEKDGSRGRIFGPSIYFELNWLFFPLNDKKNYRVVKY